MLATTTQHQPSDSSVTSTPRSHASVVRFALQLSLLLLAAFVFCQDSVADELQKYVPLIRNKPVPADTVFDVDVFIGLTAPITVTNKKGLPPGVDIVPVPGELKVKVIGTPTRPDKYDSEVTITDSSKPPKVFQADAHFLVAGSFYNARTIVATPDNNKKVPIVLIYDSGAQKTILTRADSITESLVKADGGVIDKNAAGLTQVAGVDGKKLWLTLSQDLDVSARGLDSKGKDYDDKDATVKMSVEYPTKDQKDPLLSLLGVDFVGKLPKNQGVAQFDDGSLTFFVMKKSDDNSDPSGLDGCSYTFATSTLPPTLELAPGGQAIVVSGSPYTVVSKSTAVELGMNVIGQVDLYSQDPTSFRALFLDGFFDDEDPGPLTLIQASFSIAGTALSFTNVPLLVNPFDTNKNVFGTDLFSLRDPATPAQASEMYLTPSGGLLGFGCTVSQP